MSDILFFIAIIWFVCANIVYIYGASRYMKHYNIKSAKETTPEHEQNLNKYYLNCLFAWPKFFIKSIDKK